LIRVFILADGTERADALAAQLEEDDRFEIAEIDRADVILSAGVPLRRLPARGKPIVGIGTGADEDAPFDDLLKAWLPDGARMEEITTALAAAAGGFTVLTRQQARRALRRASVPVETELESGSLTTREREVLQLMGSGCGNKAIASRLRISANTAKFHVHQIMAKLNAESRTEAVSTAIRRGMITI
jgi:DNA-binding CsgD family transcriptional regulator